MSPSHTYKPKAKSRRSPRGSTLLIVMVIMTVTSLMLLGIVESQVVQFAALHNTADYEKALYLAGAGAHAALAELEADPSWTTGIASTTFPSGSGNTYSATVASGGGGTIIVTGNGTAGGYTRKIQVTVQPN